MWRQDDIADDLRHRVDRALAAYAINQVEITMDGRDVRLAGQIPTSLEPGFVTGVVGEVWGVGSVDVSALQQSSEARDRDDPLNPRFDSDRIVRMTGDVVNPMDAQTCGRVMARLASVSAVRFEKDAASPEADSYGLLNDLAALAYQCPATRVVIGAHTDSGGDMDLKRSLSGARAEAVARFFELAGIPAGRLEVTVYGDSRPVASNASPEGRAANRRITFELQPLH
jgi:outer membrane protein OmpA-like peptidoglycan-associated protein